MALPLKVQEMLERVKLKYGDPEGTGAESVAPPREEDRPAEAAADTVALTPEMIHAGKTRRGGWTADQLAAIGLPWDGMRAGWIERLRGRVVTAAAYQRFLDIGRTAGKARGKKPRETKPAARRTIPTGEPDVIRCPLCSGAFRLRHNRTTGSPFMGCSNYPRCYGTMPVEIYRKLLGATVAACRACGVVTPAGEPRCMGCGNPAYAQ